MTDTDGLTDEQLEVWAALATLLERLPNALDAQLQRDSGVTHFEHGVLFALDRAPERTLRMSVLAGYASCTLSRLSRAVTRLEAKGWVRRLVDPGDGRFTLAVLTDAGHEQVERATLDWVHWFNTARLLAPLGYVPPAEFEEQYAALQDPQATPIAA